MRDRTLDLVIEIVLTIGLLCSAALLLFGLLEGKEAALRVGFLLLLATPAARVVVVTIGMALERDVAFTLVSLWILGVLASSSYVALHL